MPDATAPAAIRVPVWAWLLAALAVMAVYAMTMDNGAVLGAAAAQVHELVHDARHFAGVPCH